jgi:hypothetical protein
MQVFTMEGRSGGRKAKRELIRRERAHEDHERGERRWRWRGRRREREDKMN